MTATWTKDSHGLFDYDEKSSVWCLNTSTEKELFAQLSLYCSEQLGEAIELNSER